MNRLQVIQSRGHGKACRGMKRTATFQVIEPSGDGYLVKKQFRFTIGDDASRGKALRKAEEFAKGVTNGT